MTHQTHAYHIVNPSPWPLTGALSTLLMTSGLTIWFHFNSTLLLSLGLVTNVLTIYQWWRDTVRESTSQGHHAPAVQKGLWYRMVLFIISEVLFFTGFFWAFYHSSLAPTPELGGCWPPSGIHPLNPLEAPLLNTSVLLASGVSIPRAHHSLIEGNRTHILQALFITIALGRYFTLLQASEYYEAPFTISDSIYGSTFFCSHWIPWPSCHHWLHFLSRMLSATTKIPLYVQPPLWIWSCCLVLTFCRCHVAIPLCLYLLMRVLSF